MSKIKVILITLIGLFLLGCTTAENPGKDLSNRCGAGAFWSNIHFRCLNVKGKKIKKYKKRDTQSRCGVACLSAKDKMERESRNAPMMGKWIGDHWYERHSHSFRLRQLNGSNSFETASAENKSIALILNNWGLGQTNENTLETYTDNSSVEMKNQYIEISYTFNLSETTGDSMTLTLGAGIPSGEMKVTTSTNTVYRSSTVSGVGYFAVLGIELWIFELLAGYRVSSVEYEEFESSSASDLEDTYKVTGSQSMVGLGLTF